jgi:hypothetical protein
VQLKSACSMNKWKALSLGALLVLSLACYPLITRADDYKVSGHPVFKQAPRSQSTSDRETVRDEVKAHINAPKRSRDLPQGANAAELENERVELEKATQELHNARETLERKTEALKKTNIRRERHD